MNNMELNRGYGLNLVGDNMKTKCKLENCRGCAYEVEKYSVKRPMWQLSLVGIIITTLGLLFIILG